jgi:hypothetical protein
MGPGELFSPKLKSGYKRNVEYKSLTVFVYFGYTLKTKHRNMANNFINK